MTAPPRPAGRAESFLGDPAFHGFDHVVVELNGGGGCLAVEALPVAPLRIPDLTLEAWVRPDPRGTAQRQTLVSLPLRVHAMTLRLHEGHWELGQQQTWVRAPGVRAGRWQHIAGVCRHGGLILYRDARRAAVLRVPTQIHLPGLAVLGAMPDGAGYRDGYQGQLARVRLWSRALGEPELGLAMTGRLPADQGLLADWPLDEGAGVVGHNRAPAALAAPPTTPFGDARFQLVCGWPDYVIARIA